MKDHYCWLKQLLDNGNFTKHTQHPPPQIKQVPESTESLEMPWHCNACLSQKACCIDTDVIILIWMQSCAWLVCPERTRILIWCIKPASILFSSRITVTMAKFRPMLDPKSHAGSTREAERGGVTVQHTEQTKQKWSFWPRWFFFSYPKIRCHTISVVTVFHQVFQVPAAGSMGSWVVWLENSMWAVGTIAS